MEPPLGRRLFLGQRAIADLLHLRLAATGASPWHWVLLREASNANGPSQRELAGRVRIEPPTLVRQLDKLADDGYVERRADSDDRRVTRVFVTAKGRARLARLDAIAQGVDTDLRSVLTAREALVLDTALTKIHDHFTELKREMRAADGSGQARRKSALNVDSQRPTV